MLGTVSLTLPIVDSHEQTIVFLLATRTLQPDRSGEASILDAGAIVVRMVVCTKEIESTPTANRCKVGQSYIVREDAT